MAAFVPGATISARSWLSPRDAGSAGACLTNRRGCMQRYGRHRYQYRYSGGGRRRVAYENENENENTRIGNSGCTAYTPSACANPDDAKRTSLTIEAEAGKDFYGIPNPGAGGRLLLSDLRERLIRQEETIIFALIERAQFNQNLMIYQSDAFFDLKGTFLDYLLRKIESTYATVRRYTSPDEHAFTSDDLLEKPILPQLTYPATLLENTININGEIKEMYIKEIIPKICAPGDDNNYGSAACNDVSVLQALSKRIHYGKFIAEAKLQQSFEKYRALSANNDTIAIHKLLSDQTVEDVLLNRVENKARNYGRDISGGNQNGNGHGHRDVYKVRPQLISDIYRDFIIPLTKQVEIQYILFRCLHHTQNNKP